MAISRKAKYLVDLVAPAPRALPIVRGKGVQLFIDTILSSRTIILPEVPDMHEHPFEYSFDSINMVFENEVYAVFKASKRHRVIYIQVYHKPLYAVREPYNYLDPSNKKRKDFTFPDSLSILHGALYDTGFMWFWKRNRHIP
ncbi:hypothetical protein [Pseudoalteromonas ruthenica]|uniref:hypothetical protein n=1 Tax=Pseudoalteromonas ruthenica TaxID=151081 RepID=UPI00110A8934|nr:hypothetical protein [Pseudoalteromonas ruthenica]